MSVNLPKNPKEVVDRAKTDVQNELENSNPFLRNSYLSALVTGYGLRIYDFYTRLDRLLLEMFPDTATGTFAERWGGYIGIIRLPATKSSGVITIPGTASTTVPVGTVFSSTDGISYTTTTAANVDTVNASVQSIIRVGQTATVTTTSNHNLSSGIKVTISGANQTEYNVTDSITVTGPNQFTYLVTGSPATPATGTIIATHLTGFAQVESDDFGANTNQNAGAPLSLSTPLPNVLNPSFVQFLGLTGGGDQESDTDFKLRYLDKYQNPFALFNVSSIIGQAKLVPGVTRVFVQEITPAVGQVTIYFLRDNDKTGPIPGPGEVADVKNKILEIKPAHVAPDDVIVSAPTAVNISFDFDSINPDSPSMREEITKNIELLFKNGTAVGQDLTENQYKCAIFDTVEQNSGQRLIDFTLNSPVGNISIDNNEIPVLNTISF